MDKHDFIDLIKVAEGVLRIEEGCKILTGYGLETGEVTQVYLVWEILRRNSAEKFQVARNLDEDTDNYGEFVAILESNELTAEEKYERLVA